MNGAIEISLGDVTDAEAFVVARFRGADGDAVGLHGTVRGPFCEAARTLPAEFAFRAKPSDGSNAVVAEAVVIDPCLWSDDMPHLYQVDVVARRGEEALAEFHGRIGLRRLAPRRPVDFAPGTG